MPKASSSLNELLYDLKRIEENREKLSEKKIKKIYKSLSDDLTSFLASEYLKNANEDGILDYSILRGKAREARFMEEIVKNVDGITPELKKEIMTLVDETYTNCFVGMEAAVKSASNTTAINDIIAGTLVRPEVAKRAITNNISKLTLPHVLEKNRQDIIYQIKQELSVGLINGDRYEEMAKRLTERLDISYGKATNIVRTESHRNIEGGFMDCAEEIQSGLDGSDLIYTATWRTMGDQRVRPQQRRKTKKGWKTTLSKNGANHVKMEGQTVKAGELFDLGGGVKAKAPSHSGVAAQDCRCRCFIEYDLMTIEEFAKATNQTPEQVIAKMKTSKAK